LLSCNTYDIHRPSQYAVYVVSSCPNWSISISAIKSCFSTVHSWHFVGCTPYYVFGQSPKSWKMVKCRKIKIVSIQFYTSLYALPYLYFTQP
jgi:hypothetical protein